MAVTARLSAFARSLRQRWKSHLLSLGLLLAVLLGVQAWQTRDVPSGSAPDFTATVVQPDGSFGQTTLSQWRAQHPGQPVALHVWAEWCPICRAEEGSVTRLSRDWPVLTIAMQSGRAEQVAGVLAQRQLPWATAIDPRGATARQLGFKAVPAFVVVDAQGDLRGATVGYTTEIGMRLRLWWARWW
ncbi:redoxin domain-containing protein [Hydrogenophaga sp. BPS33]|uniref:redoxin domain-containing protein n=1 Tax=Hydrogenophaga sp. BPS33 TaxID=2651974 RepID=UPI00131FBF24|nr:redoxin domain-containing protein [Hydrogenophaga sp. BPS33]QHE85724.1 redoxin domain-containing protein [Hydrogenophaga sp. BPS33]